MSSTVVAITGGIGTGKSKVAELISNYGLKVIKTDDLAKDVMTNNQKVVDNIIDVFGRECYSNDYELNTAFLAMQVFGDENHPVDNLHKLNQIVHPIVIQKMMDMVEEYENAGEKLIFVESALVYEVNLEEGFDYIVVVSAKEDIVIDRLLSSRKTDTEKIKSVMSKQISNEEKIAVADFVIDNNGSIENLTESVDFIVSVLRGIE